MADAARFAEQAKKERSQGRSFVEEMGRTEPRTWQVSADKLTDVSEATAQVVRYGLGRQAGFLQQKHIEEINGFNRLKWLDEETLTAMVRVALKDGSPADDKLRFVFHLASDETSCRACGRRAFEGTDKDRSEQGAASTSQWTGTSNNSKNRTSGWWRVSWNTDKKLALVEGLTQQPRKKCKQCLAGRKRNGWHRKKSILDFENLWKIESSHGDVTLKVAATNTFSSRRRSFSSTWCTMWKEVAQEPYAGIAVRKGINSADSRVSVELEYRRKVGASLPVLSAFFSEVRFCALCRMRRAAGASQDAQRTPGVCCEDISVMKTRRDHRNGKTKQKEGRERRKKRANFGPHPDRSHPDSHQTTRQPTPTHPGGTWARVRDFFEYRTRKGFL